LAADARAGVVLAIGSFCRASNRPLEIFGKNLSKKKRNPFQESHSAFVYILQSLHPVQGRQQ